MIYRINDFYIEASSKQEAFLKYAGKRYDIYHSREDAHCLNSRYTVGCAARECCLNEKVYEISDKSADEYFRSLLEYVHEHYPRSYFVKPHQAYGYDGVLILSENNNEYAAVVAAYNEGNGVYSVGPGLMGIGFLRVDRLSCCSNSKMFLYKVNDKYKSFCREYSRFKKHRLQF